jgi:octopine/nopaline transport system substrate-binding protein
MRDILRRLVPALAIAAAIAVPAAQAKDWKKVVIATEGAYAPYNMHAPDGKLIGFEIDLANDVCKRVNLECEFVAQDWNGIIPGLTAGKYDAIMSGMSITPKRLEVIDFTRPYSNAPTTFAVAKGGPLANMPGTGLRVSLEDKPMLDKAIAALSPALKDKVIGVQVSTIQADMLNTYFKGVGDVRTYPTTEEHDLDLAAGRVDAVLASVGYFSSTLSKPGGDQFVLAGPMFIGGLLGKGTGIGLRKSDTDLKALLDKGLNEALADGAIKALSLKWFKVDISPAS